MDANFMRLKQRAFTLIELLIVVIILAILAAIIIPQFTSATTDAKQSALASDLTGLRSAIEVYQAQHNGVYPGAVATSGGSGCTGTAGTGAANSAQALIDALTMYSDANGDTCSIGSTTYMYGPYIRTGMPADPITGKGSTASGIAVTSTGTPITPNAATGGWAYDTVSGQIVMNSDALDSSGKAYSSY